MTEFTTYDELMPKIQALIAPGDSSFSKDKFSSEHHFFRRKGKWHNHDYCDACGQKGKLLCCDICPASFHLLCHEPPLDIAQVPNGPWTCSACNNIRDSKNNPSRKLYKIEFANHNATSNNVHKERKNQTNVSKDFQRRDTLSKDSSLLRDSLLFPSLRKQNSAPFAAGNSIKSVNSYPTIHNESNSAASNREMSQNSCENSFKLNSNNRTVRFESKPKNGDSSSSVFVSVNGLNSSIYDVEIKTEPGMEEVDVESLNTNRTNRDFPSKPLEKESPAGESNGSNFNVDLLNCDFIFGKDAIPYAVSETCISTMEKSCVLKNKSSSTHDKNNTNSIDKVFNVIVSETKKLNPRQFVLPKDYISDIDENLLKPEKDLDNSSCDWDSNDLLKIPSRKCYFCRGICLSGQMISCDFCPAHFHLNCLSPPLCSVPDVKWMCPLHPHHIFKKVMGNPDSITELSAWWGGLAESIDSHEVISKFIKLIKRQKKNSQVSVIGGSAKIPDIVKYHYKNPVRHIPELNDLTNRKSGCIFEEDFTLIPHELITKSNECCSRRQPQKEKPSQNNIVSSAGKENMRSVNINTVEQPTFDPRLLIEITSDDKGDVSYSKSDVNTGTCKNGENLSTWDSKNKSFRFKSFGIYDFPMLSGPVQNSKPRCEKQPWQKIEEMFDAHIDANFITGGMNSAKLHSNLKRLLIHEEIQSIVKDLPPSFLPTSAPYPFTPPFWNNDSVLKKKSSSRMHAVLCPLSHRAPLVFMHDGTLSIGTDFSNDVCLQNYGYCNLISGEHAVIFYDKLSKTYELLNYSEFNTVVDGITYTCDVSCPPKTVQPDPQTLAIQIESDSKKCSTKYSSSVGAGEKVYESTEKPKVTDGFRPPPVSRTKTSGLESRNLFKKLMTDIDKLIIKSKKEMASIAEEDLNEIAKAVKASSDANRVTKESFADKQKMKKKMELAIQLKRFETDEADQIEDDIDVSAKSGLKQSQSSANAKSDLDENPRVCDVTEQPSNQVPPVKEVITPTPAPPVTNEVKSNSVVNQTEATSLRRSERKIKRSIFATYRREMRKDKKLELNMLSSDSEDDVKVIKKKAPSVVTVEKEPEKDENEPLCNGRYVPETREKCRCQVNDLRLPDGMDSSWENSAALHHGSHIRFGCVEFVFSIVKYTKTDVSQRSYQPLRTSQSRLRKSDEKGGGPPVKKPKKGKDEDDLSSKLRSLLNVLSSKKSASSKSSNSSVENSPVRSSPLSSRSPSPSAPPNFSCLIEVSHEENERTRHEIKTEDT